jgi:heat shock protein HtpX
MFELVRANRRKSALLILLMLALLLAVGFAVGFSVYPATDSFVMGHYRYFIPVGGLAGMAVAFLIWGGQALAAFASGDRILMAAAGAREIKKEDHPRLFNVVEEMTIAAQLPAVPKVYIMEDMSMNAFAAGRNPKHAAVAVTQGLLGRLNRDQLQGVIAHEISHIANRDILFMTFASIMLGSIIMITEIFLRVMWYSNLGGSRRYTSRRSNRNDGAARLVLLVVALVLAIVAPLLAQLLYFACSRQREYLADAGGAVYTRYPEGLASALEIISGNPGTKASVSKAMAPMYIINPLEAGARSLTSLTSTHPPVEERIRILRSMGGGASYNAYAAAAGKISGAGKVHIPQAALAAELAAVRQAQAARAAEPGQGSMGPALMAATAGQARAPEPEPEPGERQRFREAGDLVRTMNRFRFLQCACGLKMKIPPEYKKTLVKCPRCGKIHSLEKTDNA